MNIDSFLAYCILVLFSLLLLMFFRRRKFKFQSKMTGIEYEHYCAKILRRAGWRVKVTKASGDQGVDLIIRKWFTKYVVQCKKYKGPVGNDAVQQIYAGSKFYNKGKPIVVTNSRYTKSAQELAKKLSVKLLHHSDLISL